MSSFLCQTTTLAAQGVPRVSKESEGPNIPHFGVFCADIQPKLNELNKNRQNQQKWLKYAGFLVRWRALNCVFNLVHYHYLELSELADHLVNEINTR